VKISRCLFVELKPGAWNCRGQNLLDHGFPFSSLLPFSACSRLLFCFACLFVYPAVVAATLSSLHCVRKKKNSIAWRCMLGSQDSSSKARAIYIYAKRETKIIMESTNKEVLFPKRRCLPRALCGFSQLT
jgi:hypothetical protein